VLKLFEKLERLGLDRFELERLELKLEFELELVFEARFLLIFFRNNR